MTQATQHAIKNFHLPLPEELYEALRHEAARLGRPATAVARDAVEAWLGERRRAMVKEAIARCTGKQAGTEADLDPLAGEGLAGSAAGAKAAAVRRGEVYWAELAPRPGAEQTGRRPVIVVSHDGFNEVPTWRSVIVVPLSTSDAQARRGPTAILLGKGTGGLRENSVALRRQVATLDRAKLSERLGVLPRAALDEVAEGLRVALDLA
jgi:mRNA interferase MazF